jgi:hypothetical protein
MSSGQGYASLPAPPSSWKRTSPLTSSTTTASRSCAGWLPTRWPFEDAAGNLNPDRERSSEKIDGVVGWRDALFAWATAPEELAKVEPFFLWA